MATDITKSLIDLLLRQTADGGRKEVIDHRAQGLILRVGRRGATWTWKHAMNRQTLRLTIGAWPDWTIVEAREVASAATAMIRAKRGVPNEAWMQEQRVRLSKTDVGAAEAITPATFSTWDFGKAREEYLAWCKAKRAETTWRDRVAVLFSGDLRRFERRRVSTIERREMAIVLAEIHDRGSERMAEHVAEVIRPMWTFLQDDARAHLTGVKEGVMERLKAPERSRPIDDKGQFEIGLGQYVPSVDEMARLIAIADKGVMSPDMSVVLAMLAYTSQRRRMVASAVVEDFEDLGERGAIWWIPAAHRKTAVKRGIFSAHAVPLPPAIWNRIKPQIARALARQPSNEELDALQEFAPTPEPLKPTRRRSKRLPPQSGVRPQASHRHWLFPGSKPRRYGDDVTHIHPDTITHRLRELPDIFASVHELRNGFATHGEAVLGFTRLQTRTILDHGEGGQTNDVTSKYALHSGIHGKWPLMIAWCDFLEAALPAARKDLPSKARLKAAIAAARAKNAAGHSQPADPAPKASRAKKPRNSRDRAS